MAKGLSEAKPNIKPSDGIERPIFGGDGEEVTPVPIPNTEVKLFSADGTARAAGWESRTPPKSLLKTRGINNPGFFTD